MKSYFRYAEHFTDEGTQTVAEPGLPGDQRYRLHGVERALDTLEFLAEAGQDGVTLT